MVKRAILSVSDKTGIVELARRLADQGVTLLSTGGTMKAIEQAGISVTGVSDVTGFPECLDGRVKTLHPAIHAGLLAVRENPEHMKQLEQLGVEPIDMVVINLYPFRATIEKPGVTFDEAIENIDIGGPTMLRAAAKNAQDVVVVIDPADYDRVLTELETTGDVSLKTKRYLQYKVFEHTAQYDCMIQQYLRSQLEDAPEFPQNLTVTFEKVQEMRYGENPHQKAAFYRDLGDIAGTLRRPGSCTARSFPTTTSTTRTARWNCCASLTQRRSLRSSTATRAAWAWRRRSARLTSWRMRPIRSACSAALSSPTARWTRRRLSR